MIVPCISPYDRRHSCVSAPRGKHSQITDRCQRTQPEPHWLPQTGQEAANNPQEEPLPPDRPVGLEEEHPRKEALAPHFATFSLLDSASYTPEPVLVLGCPE